MLTTFYVLDRKANIYNNDRNLILLSRQHIFTFKYVTLLSTPLNNGFTKN